MKAFLYCRVAHQDTFALEHQRFLLELYAKRAGYTIIGAVDEYGSGLTLDRPALQKVTEAVAAGKVDVVLVHSQGSGRSYHVSDIVRKRAVTIRRQRHELQKRRRHISQGFRCQQISFRP